MYRFVTAEEIISLGINTATGNLEESIGDHTKKIIQENEGQLMKIPGVGKEYTVQLNNWLEVSCVHYSSIMAT